MGIVIQWTSNATSMIEEASLTVFCIILNLVGILKRGPEFPTSNKQIDAHAHT